MYFRRIAVKWFFSLKARNIGHLTEMIGNRENESKNFQEQSRGKNLISLLFFPRSKMKNIIFDKERIVKVPKS
jgi:hypothetical protein